MRIISKMLKYLRGTNKTAEDQLNAIHRRFLADTFGVADPPMFTAPDVDLGRFLKEDEKALLDATSDWLASVRKSGAKTSTALAQSWLADELARNQEKIEQIGIVTFVSERFDFQYAPERYRPSGQNCVYVKLNHGFWEDIYALFVKPSLQHQPRRLTLDISRAGTLHSGFLDALICQLLRFSNRTPAGTVFEGVNLAGGFIGGHVPTNYLIRHLDDEPPLNRAVVTGAAVGAAAFFEKLFGAGRVVLNDGCLPKYGYETGALQEILTDWAGATDQVIFVVPPHLRDIRLNIPAAQDQKIIHISRTIVQESWIATLHATASRILTPMLAGRRVLVISQCGPFTVLLGLFLAQAADELGLNPGQLAYFDLGQVTDFANVEQAGNWLKNSTTEDTGLFVRSV